MTDKGERQRRLGRGLDALFRAADGEDAGGIRDPVDTFLSDRRVHTVPISRLVPNPFQPRRDFEDDTLDDLAESIREHGILQPLVVRPNEQADGSYEIVAGERRWRAAQRAQVHDVPVVVHSFTDEEALTVALIENIQREDLSPLDEAQAYVQLAKDFRRTQHQVAQLVGKSRSHVANMMRLMDLPPEVRSMLSDGRLTMGHGRALLSARDPLALARRTETDGLSVRAVEALVRQGSPKNTAAKRKGPRPSVSDVDTIALERRIDAALGLRSRIRFDGRRGTVTLAYETLEQLDNLVERLDGISGTD